MKDYYVCIPEDDVDNSFHDSNYIVKSVCAFSDNEFVFKQYLVNTYPILKHIIRVDYSLMILKYTVRDIDELFSMISKEYGIKIDSNCEIVSVDSANNPGLSLYMTYGVLFDGDGILPEPIESINKFLQMLWSSVELYTIYNSIIRWPEPIKNMWKLIIDKYIALIFGLNYTDIGAWSNTDLQGVVNKMLPDYYKGVLSIYDVLDDAMLWIHYNEWTTDSDDS